MEEAIVSKGDQNEKPITLQPELPKGQSDEIGTSEMRICSVNENLKLVKKFKLVVASDFRRIYCKKCKSYFDSKTKYTTFKCTMCGEMNQVTDDMIKSLKNAHTLEANNLKVIEEGEGNYILICDTNGEAKIKAERTEI